MAAALLMILKVLGWVLAAVLLAVLVLLLLPAQAELSYESGQFSLRGGFLGLLLPLYPHKRGKKKKSPAASKKKQAPAQASAKAAGHAKRKITPRLALQILASSGWAIKKLCRSVHIRDLCIRYTVQGEDAAQTALTYGRMHAALGTAYAMVRNLFDVRVKSISIQPDFAGQSEAQKHFSCKITAQLYIIVVIAVYMLYKAVLLMRKTAAKQ